MNNSCFLDLKASMKTSDTTLSLDKRFILCHYLAVIAVKCFFMSLFNHTADFHEYHFFLNTNLINNITSLHQSQHLRIWLKISVSFFFSKHYFFFRSRQLYLTWFPSYLLFPWIGRRYKAFRAPESEFWCDLFLDQKLQLDC